MLFFNYYFGFCPGLRWKLPVTLVILALKDEINYNHFPVSERLISYA